MGADLAELLTLLHDARGREATLRATVREWQHHERMMEAFGRRGGVTRYAWSGEPAPATSERIARIWLAPPDCVREEHDDEHGTVEVARGDRWWRYDRLHGTLSNADEPGTDGAVGNQFAWLVEVPPLLGALRFTEVEEGEQAGRRTLRARAVPRELRPGTEIALHVLGVGDADEVVLDVDAQRGVLLRIEDRIRGEPYLVREVTEIAFDEEFPEETFDFTPPPGEVAGPRVPSIEHDVTAARAVALAPFPVWILARVPRDWDVEVTVIKETDGPLVVLHYAADHGTQGLVVSQAAAGTPVVDELPGGEWRRDVREGRELQLRPPVEDWHPAQVRLELDGTYIQLHSDSLGIDALADAAAGLVRAPEAEPRLGR